MASRTAITLSFLTCFIIIIISFPFPAASRNLPSNSNKVSLGIYCEAMCPFCSRFLAYYLDDLIKDAELFSIVDLYINPWGQTTIMSNGTWDCVHGPGECLLNTVEACAINVWPKLDDHYPFIRCAESDVYKSLYERRPNHWEKCFQQLGLNPKPIVDCVTNGKGVELELEYAAKTSALEPPIEYVPWIVVDGEHIRDYPKFVDYICKAYKGKNPPKACQKSPQVQANQVDAPICYRKTKIPAQMEPDVASV